MHIEFSSRLDVGFDITAIDGTVLDIYIHPSSSSASQRNLTWEAVSFNGSFLLVQVHFDSPLSISPELQLDRIVVEFLDTSLLRLEGKPG